MCATCGCSDSSETRLTDLQSGETVVIGTRCTSILTITATTTTMGPIITTTTTTIMAMTTGIITAGAPGRW